MNIVNCIWLTAVIWMGAKPVGYLARIGPAPLRFQAPAKGPEATVALPPLRMCEPPLMLRDMTTNQIATVEPPAQPAPPPVVTQPVQVEPAFTPQMMLQFFNRNGTNQEPSVFVPYQFSPPPTPVIPAPPSKATYSKK